MGFDIRGAVGGIINTGRNIIDQGREVVENTVQKGQEIVQGGVNQARDVFEGAKDVVDNVVDFVNGDSSDKKNDGVQVYPDGSTRPAGSPLERDPNQPLILQVNGISTTLEGQDSALEAVQNRTGAQVIGIHNATEGFLQDLGQAALDTIGKGKNPAVDSLADTMYSELEAGREVHIMAHSQGGLVTSRAVEQVKQRLMMEGGLTQAQAEERLQNVKIESFGSAAPSWPDGPQYVHYVNRLDPVPTALGLGPGIPGVGNPGRGAQVHHFEQLSGAHNFNDTYMNQRVPFDQARSGDFTQRDINAP